MIQLERRLQTRARARIFYERRRRVMKLMTNDDDKKKTRRLVAHFTITHARIRTHAHINVHRVSSDKKKGTENEEKKLSTRLQVRSFDVRIKRRIQFEYKRDRSRSALCAAAAC